MSRTLRTALTYPLAALAVALGLGLFTGCQTDADSAIDKVQKATDQAQAWLDRNRDLARDIEEMGRAYQQGNTEQAAQALDRIRDRVNWDEGLLANDFLRTRLLDTGTSIYEAMDRPEKARALLESALPHLDGPARERWQQALNTYQNLPSAAEGTRTAE
jgi:tetratricopeptide (TPR) repeat protein